MYLSVINSEKIFTFHKISDLIQTILKHKSECKIRGEFRKKNNLYSSLSLIHSSFFHIRLQLLLLHIEFFINSFKVFQTFNYFKIIFHFNFSSIKLSLSAFFLPPSFPYKMTLRFLCFIFEKIIVY